MDDQWATINNPVPDPPKGGQWAVLEDPVGAYLADATTRGVPWEWAARDLAVPDADRDRFRQGYQLGLARREAAGKDESRWRRGLAVTPWAGTALQTADAALYANAKKKLAEGKADPDHLRRIAEYEEIQKRVQALPVAQQVGRNLLGVPALVAEAGLASRLFARVGEAAAPSILTREGAKAAARAFPREAAVGVPRAFATPSMWTQQAAQRAGEQGGEVYEAKNVLPALGYAMIQSAVFGTGAKIGQASPGGVLGRTAAGAGAMGVEQAVGDAAVSAFEESVLPEAYQTKTKYGSLGAVVRAARSGKAEDRKDAWTKAATEAATFALFSLMQAGGGRAPRPGETAPDPAAPDARPQQPVLKAFADAADELAGQGLSREAAGRRLQNIGKLFAAVANADPATALRSAENLATLDYGSPALNRYARTLGDIAVTEAQTRLRSTTSDARPPVTQTDATDSTIDGNRLNEGGLRDNPLLDDAVGEAPGEPRAEGLRDNALLDEATSQPGEPAPEFRPGIRPPQEPPGRAAEPRPPEPAPEPVPAGDRAAAGRVAIGDAAGRGRAAEMAQAEVESGGKAVYVDLDVDNMAGLVREVGPGRAGDVVAEMVGIYREELAKVGEAEAFRHAGDPKGDEHSIVVRGADLAAVNTAMRAAQARVAGVVRSAGLADLPHAKGGRLPGVGLSGFAEPFVKGRRPGGTFAEAEAGTETAKSRRVAEDAPAPEPTAGEAAGLRKKAGPRQRTLIGDDLVGPGKKPAAKRAPRGRQLAPGQLDTEGNVVRPVQPRIEVPAPEPAPGPPARPADVRTPEDTPGRDTPTPEADLAARFEAAGLTPRERHVLTELARGRTEPDIAGDDALAKRDGTPPTRQYVDRVVGQALTKLGVSKKDLRGVLVGEAELNRMDLIERGGRAELEGMRFSEEEANALRPAVVRRIRNLSEEEKRQEVLSNLVSQKLKEIERAERSGKRITEEELRRWTEQAEGIAAQVAAGRITAKEGRRQAKAQPEVAAEAAAEARVEPAPGPPAPKGKKGKKAKIGDPPPGKSLQEAVISFGGIDTDSAEFKRFFSNAREARERGLTRPGLFKKGGVAIDILADSLHSEGHLPDNDPQTLVNYLLEKKESGLRAGDQGAAERAYLERQAAEEVKPDRPPPAGQLDIFGTVRRRPVPARPGTQLDLTDLLREAWTEKAREFARDNDLTIEEWSASGRFKADGDWYEVGKGEDGYPVRPVTEDVPGEGGVSPGEPFGLFGPMLPWFEQAAAKARPDALPGDPPVPGKPADPPAGVAEAEADAAARLATLFRERGLNEGQAHVVVERAKGRTLDDIATDVALTKGGKKLFRQSIHRSYQRALKRLGVTEEQVAGLMAAERSNNMIALAERQRFTDGGRTVISLERDAQRLSDEQAADRVRKVKDRMVDLSTRQAFEDALDYLVDLKLKEVARVEQSGRSADPAEFRRWTKWAEGVARRVSVAAPQDRLRVLLAAVESGGLSEAARKRQEAARRSGAGPDALFAPLIPGGGGPGRTRPDAVPDAVKVPDGAVESRVAGARGATGVGAWDRVKRRAAEMWKSMTRAEVHLPTDGKYDVAREGFRLLKSVPSAAADRATRTVAWVVNDLGPRQLAVLERFLLAENMLDAVSKGQPLRFGFTDRGQVERYVTQVNEVAGRVPEVVEALRRREAERRGLVGEAVSLGILDQAHLDNPAYFHQMVRDYQESNAAAARGGSLPVTYRRSFEKARTTGVDSLPERFDYNTSFLEAEAHWMTELAVRVGQEKVLRDYFKPYDRARETKSAARRAKMPWQSYLRRNHPDLEVWSPEPGQAFFPAVTLAERAAAEAMAKGFAAISKSDLKAALVLGGRKRPMVIPKELAAQLNAVKSPPPVPPAGKLSADLINGWKTLTLFSPTRLAGYMLRNLSGDVEPVLAAAPGSAKHWAKAARDLKSYYLGDDPRTHPDIRRAVELGVLDSSMSQVELPDVRDLRLLRRFSDPKTRLGYLASLPGRYFETAKNLNAFREGVGRLAAFRYYKGRLDANEPIHYGTSNRRAIDALRRARGNDVAAAKLARDLLGDYRNLTEMGDTLRRHAAPFWSWVEVNFKRWPKLAQNTVRDVVESRDPTRAAAAAGAVALRGAALMAMLQLWNNTFFPDEEADLTPEDRASPHLILGRREDGSVRVFRRLGSMSDFARWFGVEDAVRLYPNYQAGQVSAGAAAAEVAKAPLEQAVQSTRPDVKGAFELTTGQSLFPDPFNPRPADRGEIAAGLLGGRDELRALRGLAGSGDAPRPGRGVRMLGAGVVNPGQAAVSETLSLVELFDRSRGRGGRPRVGPPRIARMRDAAAADDFDAFRDAKARYLKDAERAGSSRAAAYREFQESLKNLDPLTRVPERDRRAFREFLTPAQERRLGQAREYAKAAREKLRDWWRLDSDGGRPDQAPVPIETPYWTAPAPR